MFIDRLLFLCNKNNTDISTVLRSLGLSTSKGTAWRKGSVPNGEILLMLSTYFHVSTDYLLGNTDDPRPMAELTGEEPKKESSPQEARGELSPAKLAFIDKLSKISDDDLILLNGLLDSIIARRSKETL